MVQFLIFIAIFDFQYRKNALKSKNGAKKNIFSENNHQNVLLRYLIILLGRIIKMIYESARHQIKFCVIKNFYRPKNADNLSCPSKSMNENIFSSIWQKSWQALKYWHFVLKKGCHLLPKDCQLSDSAINDDLECVFYPYAKLSNNAIASTNLLFILQKLPNIQ